jgi:glycosyltransferase involved in cell wall biosynthesis
LIDAAPSRRQRLSDRKYRVAYLVSHPIQYQAPLLRLISAQPDIDLTVFFQSDMSLRPYADRGFGQAVKWDVPLVDGYRHEFLPGIWRHGAVTAQRPINWGLASRLNRSRFDALWVHGYARWVNWTAMCAARARGLAVLVRDEATLFSTERSPLRQQAKRVFFRALSQVADAFLSIGSANRDYYLANGIPLGRIFSMPYCVDNEFFAERAREARASREQLRRELQLGPGNSIILYASKFEPRKRARDLLLAYAGLVSRSDAAAQARLLFLGDGELRPSLEVEARRKGLHGVRFLGFRNQSELPAFYDLCDVFVLPSVSEPWGLVVNEVMATGKPVVVSDRVGCARDLVHDGRNGFVFPAGDIDALTEALARVLEDRNRAAGMGIASREIMAKWSFTEDIEGLRLALRSILG